MNGWADPYGYLISLLLFGVLAIAQLMRWASLGKRVDPPSRTWADRARAGMPHSRAGRLWLRHPWLRTVTFVAAAVAFGPVFNTFGTR